MKKILIFILTITLLLTGCASGSSVNLKGEWQAEGMSATITEDTITVYWESDGTKALYWSGSYDNSNNSFASVNDKEKTNSAIMASGADEKVFTVKNDKLTCEVTVMGVTTTVEFTKK